MANEITFTASLSVSKIPPMSSADGMNNSNNTYSLSSGLQAKGVILAGTSATVIPLEQVTTPGWAAFYNSDSTNYVSIQDGSGGTEFLRILPGRYNYCTLGPAVVPYAKANTASCYLQYYILNGG